MPTPVLIIIPTFNEAGAIAGVIAEIERVAAELCDYEIHILQIDDSSTDNTSEIAQAANYPHFHQVVRPEKLGLGTAYLYGFRWALAAKEGFQFVMEMDGDGSHLPESIPAFLSAAQSIPAPDLVLGTRWMPGGLVSNWPWHRRVISRAGTKYAQKALKLPLRDLTSGYRLFARSALEKLAHDDLASKGYSFQIETAMRIVDSGGWVVEIPIHFVERTKGRSKMSGAIAFEAWRRVTVWALTLRLGYRR
jgi:glycosyltransferase involved in cell wall biosynthesis